MTAIIRLFACLVALFLLAPATASATHWKHQWPDAPPQEQDGDRGQPDDLEHPAPEPAPLPEPVPPPAPQPPDSEPEPEPEVPLVTTPSVAGTVAMLRTNGKAAIPRGAPRRVRAIIAAANQIAGKPYKWGGGHAKLVDRGYDCSGTVSYALIRSGTGLLSAPLVSGSFTKWGAAGEGRWVSVYANKGHVYMEVAGLRLDTSTVGWGDKGVRWRPVTGRRKGFKARHPAGL